MTLGILLAGGRGSRLAAGAPKALVDVGGRTLLAHAIGALVPVCDEIVVVAPDAIELPPLRHRRVVDDAEGPLPALVAAFESCEWERAVALGVDFPLLRPAMLLALVERLGGADACVPRPGGVPQPLAAVYGPRGAARVADAWRAGERSVVRALERLEPRFVDDPELDALPGGSAAFFNLNTPGDRDEAERRLARARGDAA